MRPWEHLRLQRAHNDEADGAANAFEAFESTHRPRGDIARELAAMGDTELASVLNLNGPLAVQGARSFVARELADEGGVLPASWGSGHATAAARRPLDARYVGPSHEAHVKRTGRKIAKQLAAPAITHEHRRTLELIHNALVTREGSAKDSNATIANARMANHWRSIKPPEVWLALDDYDLGEALQIRGADALQAARDHVRTELRWEADRAAQTRQTVEEIEERARRFKPAKSKGERMAGRQSLVETPHLGAARGSIWRNSKSTGGRFRVYYRDETDDHFVGDRKTLGGAQSLAQSLAKKHKLPAIYGYQQRAHNRLETMPDAQGRYWRIEG